MFKRKGVVVCLINITTYIGIHNDIIFLDAILL
jgi:hypothetical protein